MSYEETPLGFSCVSFLPPSNRYFWVKTQRNFAQKAGWMIRDKTLNAALNVGLDLICYCQQSNKLKHSCFFNFSGDFVPAK